MARMFLFALILTSKGHILRLQAFGMLLRFYPEPRLTGLVLLNELFLPNFNDDIVVEKASLESFGRHVDATYELE